MSPQIVYQLNNVILRAEKLSNLAETNKISILIAVKSLPHEETLNKLESHLNGYDISNSREFNLTSGTGFFFITNCPLEDLSFTDNLKTTDYLISCNSSHYAHEIIKLNKPFAIRLRSSDLIVDKKLKNSRFGLTSEQVLQLGDKLFSNPLFGGFHFHHGGEDNSLQTYKSGIIAIKELISRTGSERSLSINLGGGYANLTIDGMKSLFDYARKELHQHKIFIEPGRYLTENSAKCFAKVIDISEDGDSLIVTLNVSRECHLKWSRISGIQIIKNSEITNRYKSKRLFFYGNTCFENDSIGSCDYEHDQEIGIGDEVLLSNISGYSLAWNTSFNGIPKINISFK